MTGLKSYYCGFNFLADDKLTEIELKSLLKRILSANCIAFSNINFYECTKLKIEPENGNSTTTTIKT